MSVLPMGDLRLRLRAAEAFIEVQAQRIATLEAEAARRDHHRIIAVYTITAILIAVAVGLTVL